MHATNLPLSNTFFTTATTTGATSVVLPLTVVHPVRFLKVPFAMTY